MSAKAIAERILHSLGAVNVIRAGKSGKVRILMYHRFPGSAETVTASLSAQCEHLRKFYHPVSLTEIADSLKSGSALPPNSLAITVDDGYRDFATAFPVFHGFGFQPVIYVASQLAAGAIQLWTDQVHHLLCHSSLDSVTVPFPDGTAMHLSLIDSGQRIQAIHLLNDALVKLPHQQRLAIVASLPERTQTLLPTGALPGFEALTWKELGELARTGAEIGAHSRTHPIISSLSSEEEIHAEIGGCKTEIENAVGVPVRHFCFPNGKHPDYNDVALQAVREAGFETAVIAEPGFVDAATDRFQMPRIGAEPDSPLLYYQRRVAGFRL